MAIHEFTISGDKSIRDYSWCTWNVSFSFINTRANVIWCFCRKLFFYKPVILLAPQQISINISSNVLYFSNPIFHGRTMIHLHPKCMDEQIYQVWQLFSLPACMHSNKPNITYLLTSMCMVCKMESLKTASMQKESTRSNHYLRCNNIQNKNKVYFETLKYV